PRRRVADADRRRDRLRPCDRRAVDERRGTGRLEAEHAWPSDRAAGRLVFLEAGPVRRDVARVADGDGEDVGRPAEVVADLERGRLLAGQPVRVDRVHEPDRAVRGTRLGERADDAEGVVEVAVDRDEARAGDDCLVELAGGGLASWLEYEYV